MAENSTIVSLPSMLDLALNCPELGTFNLNILHVLLHVVLQKVDNGDLAVEFRGDDSGRIQHLLALSNPSKTPFLSEYSLVTTKEEKAGKTKKEVSKKKSKTMSLQDIKSLSKQDMLKEEGSQKEGTKKPKEDTKKAVSADTISTKAASKTSKELQTIVVVDSNTSLPHSTIAINRSQFEILRKDVNHMKSQLAEITGVPSNSNLIEAAREGSKESTPIVEMYQMMTIAKRVDAAEAGLEKLASLIEDVVKGNLDPNDPKALEILEKAAETKHMMDTDKNDISAKSSNLEKRVTTLEGMVNDLRSYTSQDSIATSGSSKPRKLKDPKKKTPSIVEESEEQEVEEGGSVHSESVQERNELSPVTGSMGVLALLPVSDAMAIIQENLEVVRGWIDNNASVIETLVLDVTALREQLSGEDGSSPVAPDVKFNVMETRIKECKQLLADLETQQKSQISTMTNQYFTLQKEISDMTSKMENILPGGDTTEVDENTAELYNKISALEKAILHVSDTAKQLQTDKLEHDKSFEAVLEQIDTLKIIKANREDLEDALDDKADACMINRKVSHDQFDAACDDLSKGIEETLEKLTQQEELWRQALDTIQREVGNKLDKVEVDPLRDFVNEKLRSLQEKFKSLTALRKEQEAAATKSKFLRNVNCISCDKDVVMRKEMDPSLKPQAFAMPPPRNIAPYLAYELDQLRKQQKCVPNSKNLNLFESALKSKGSKDKSHVCNRYCGGSHTVTTPQQRVTRLGHFLEQWGPEIAPVNDEYVRGNDKQMYKSRDEVAAAKAMNQDKGKGKNSLVEVSEPAIRDAPPQQDQVLMSAKAHDALEQYAINEANEGRKEK